MKFINNGILILTNNTKNIWKNYKENCIEQFNIIKSLVSNNKVSTIIHAGDPDREGELLIRETLYKIKTKSL